MPQHTMHLVDLSLELFGACVLLATFVGTLRMNQKSERWNRYFHFMMISAIILLSMNSLQDLLELNEYDPSHPLYIACGTMVTMSYHLTYTLFVAFITVYIRQYNEKVSDIPLFCSNLIFLLASLLRVSTLAGFLPEGPGFFFIGRVSGQFIALLTCHLLLRYRKDFETWQEWAMLSIVPVLPILSSILRAVGFPRYLVPMEGVISLIFVNNFLHNNQEIKMRQQADQLETQKLQLMVSQIQPHFTFNVLNAIYVLCDTNPAQAREMIDAFSQYLRANLDSLSSVDVIPFPRELELVEHYVYLEKMRFGEDLVVNYELQCKDFSLPPLTIQPLMENAIKHGVMKKPQGGTVTLRSWETTDFYVITVSDDGVGFNIADLRNPAVRAARKHVPVGLKNVRYRLRAICNGNLVVESTPGTGTTVKVLIPKAKEVSQ